MDIHNFEDEIDDIILDRGYDYYTDNAIIKVSKNEDTYEFIVAGTYNYKVKLTLHENEIVYSSCNCPYDMGPICKHETASMYKLRDILTGKSKFSDTFKEYQDISSNIKSDIESVLKKLSKEDLINILLPIVKTDKILEKMIYLNYTDVNSQEEFQYVSTMIDSILNRYNHNNYLDWDEVEEIADKLEEAYNIVSEIPFTNKNAIIGIDEYFLFINAAIQVLEITDDSSYRLFGFVEEMLENLEEYIEKVIYLGEPYKQQVFNKLLILSEDSILCQWETWNFNIICSCAKVFKEDKHYREKLIKICNDKIKRTKSEQERSFLHSLIYDFIDEYGTKEEVKQYIYNNLDICKFRQKYLDLLKEDKNYEEIIKFSIEIEKRENYKSYEKDEWKKERYKAYEFLGDVKNQKALVKELLIDGNKEYYEKFKSFYKPNEFAVEYIAIKQILKRKDHQTYQYIIDKENDLPELVELVKNFPYLLPRYVFRLKADYYDIILPIYENMIKSKMNLSSCRAQYREIGKYLEDFSREIGSKEAIKLKQEIQAKYPRHRALQEELNKIKL
ncbi:MAG: hypothetical protein ATN32_05045 [Candidatus Epulonipiscium fishelsonii]|nr:MAG: hypothetical protein ATN32_05045 [Epulopiscium sp. AS2M-Bin002]